MRYQHMHAVQLASSAINHLSDLAWGLDVNLPRTNVEQTGAFLAGIVDDLITEVRSVLEIHGITYEQALEDCKRRRAERAAKRAAEAKGEE